MKHDFSVISIIVSSIHNCRIRNCASNFYSLVSGSQLGLILKLEKHSQIWEFNIPTLTLNLATVGDITRSWNVKFPDLGTGASLNCVVELLLQCRNNPHTKRRVGIRFKRVLCVIETHVTINCHTYLQVNVIVS